MEYYATSPSIPQNSVRPVIRIKDVENIEGLGTKDNPFKEKSLSTNTSNIKVGEYISVPGSSKYCNKIINGRCLFRVISKDSNSVKVIFNGLLPQLVPFGTVNDLTDSGELLTILNDFANGISDLYRYTGNKTFGIEEYVDGTSYITVLNKTYSGNVGLPVIGELFTSNDIDFKTSYRFYESFANLNTIENYNLSDNFWTMSRGWGSDMTLTVSYEGIIDNKSVSEKLGVRPVMFFKKGTSSDLTFTKGDGTAENPYFLGN